MRHPTGGFEHMGCRCAGCRSPKSKSKGRRPWIVFGRSLGVVRPVARFAREDRARARARREGLFVAHVDQISEALATALGVKS